MDFAHTRQENDEALLGRIDAIRGGTDLEVLEPFAKAYLGLFYDIDSHVAPAERLDLLANQELALAIKEGLVNILQKADLPSPQEIARASLTQESLSIGYAILAGVSLYSAVNMGDISKLPEQTLKAAICFHHFISTFHEDDWYRPLIFTKPALAADTLLAMWQVLINEKRDFLPGLRPILREPELTPLLVCIIVPLLRMWRRCRHRDLLQLLSLAILHVDRQTLLAAAQDMLAKGELLSLRNQVYWQATAFLLAPEEQGQNMINFMGQEKIKLLPFLDFVIPLLDKEDQQAFTLSPAGYTFMIRCLAQKFTPQVDVYDNLGEITLKVLWLFYQLACFTAEEGGEALKSLRRVRVLKLYSDIFDAVADYQSGSDRPDFQGFVQALRDEGRLRVKKNWHDVR